MEITIIVKMALQKIFNMRLLDSVLFTTVSSGLNKQFEFPCELYIVESTAIYH